MRVNVLVLNVGSASLKFQLVRTDADRIAHNTDEKLARGQIERLGGESIWSVRSADGAELRGTAPLRDHRAAVEQVVRWLTGPTALPGVGLDGRIDGVGHRVVHGGEH